VKRPLGIALVLVLLTGCAAGSPAPSALPSAPPSTPSAVATPKPSATSTPGATGAAPSVDQIDWAGDVCSDTAALQTEVQGLAAAAATGGADAVAAVGDQMTEVSAAAGTLVDTVKAPPSGTADDPRYTPVQSAIEGVDQSLQTLQGSASRVDGASGAALVSALATVVVDTGAVLTDVAATARAITTAMQDRASTVGQSFRAAPECTALSTS
jgi:hypothetical protein